MELATRCLALITALLLHSPSNADTRVDLELVLAVDASSSVNEVEYALQMGGIVAAFRDRSVTDAIGRGLHGRIAVAMVVWADPLGPKDITSWYVISGAEEAHAFAAMIEIRPRFVGGGTTGIGDAIAAAVSMLRDNEIDGIRQVIDVSGDGVDNSAISGFWSPIGATYALARAREDAEALGIIINGLAILNEVEDLDEWFREHVRVGPESFVLSADDYTDFRRAIRAKLLREFGSGPVLSDCLRCAGTPVRPGHGAAAETIVPKVWASSREGAQDGDHRQLHLHRQHGRGAREAGPLQRGL